MTTPQPIDWLFRDRETGEIVIWQWPSIPLWVFIVAAAVRRVFSPEGTLGTAVAVVATVGLLTWAGLEVVSGVNPFRRILGAVVAALTIAGLLLS